MSKPILTVCIALALVSCAHFLTSNADAPTPFVAPAPGSMTPQQKAAVERAKSQIQALVDQMDVDLEQRREADYLAHRDPMFAITNSHDAWRSATNCRADIAHLFNILLRADRRSVVQTVTLNGLYAEAFISRHGSMITKDIPKKSTDTTQVDSVSREVFEWHTNHWLEYRSYTLAEQVKVDGKDVKE